MHCEDCQPLLVDLLYGELNASESAAVREHLAGCVECAQAYAELQATLEFVDRLPLEAPSAAVDEAIIGAAKKKAATHAAGGRGGSWLQSPQLAMAAAALLVIGVGIATNFKFGTTPDDLPREAAQVEAAEVEAAQPPPAPAVEEEKTPQAVAIATKEAPAPVSQRKKPVAKRRAKRSAEPSGIQRDKLDALGDSAEPYDRAAPARGAAALAGNEASTSSAGGLRAPEARKGQSVAASEGTTLLRAANRLRDRQDCKGAVRVYERFLREFPTDSKASRAKLDAGRCYRELGQTKRARHWLEQAARDTAVASAAKRELAMMEVASRARDSNTEPATKPAAAGDAER